MKDNEQVPLWFKFLSKDRGNLLSFLVIIVGISLSINDKLTNVKIVFLFLLVLTYIVNYSISTTVSDSEKRRVGK